MVYLKNDFWNGAGGFSDLNLLEIEKWVLWSILESGNSIYFVQSTKEKSRKTNKTKDFR